MLIVLSHGTGSITGCDPGNVEAFRSVTTLVTGGAGYIGSHMVHALADAGERVVVLDNLTTGFDWSVAPDVPLVVGDTGDQARVAALLAEHRVDAIIHFAASIVVPDSVRDPLGYYRNNTANSRALIETAVKHGVRHFIFSSTAAVYGNPERMPVGEDDRTTPTSPYGSSKLMTEIMLRDAGAAHGLRHVILRYFNVAGADPLRPDRSVHQGGDPSHQGRGRGGARTAREGRRVRHRLSDAGRYLHPGLYSRVRSRRRASRRARLPARRRRLDHAQLRLRPRFLRARRDRDREADLRRRFHGRARRPPGGRSRANRRGMRARAFHARMATAIRRSRDHHRARAGMGAPTFGARALTPASLRLRTCGEIPRRMTVRAKRRATHPTPRAGPRRWFPGPAAGRAMKKPARPA